MMLGLALLSLILFILQAASYPDQRPNYIISDIKGNWHQADDYCKSQGMVLASVLNSTEQTQLAQLMAEQLDCSEQCRVWIGGNDLALEGTFKWAHTGKRIVGYSNWAPDQPDNSYEGRARPGIAENCLEIIKRGTSFNWNWNDYVCAREQFFVCQKVTSCVEPFK